MVSDTILTKWQAGKPEPIYIFYGEEEFLRSELLQQAAEVLLPDESTRSFNFDLLYGADTYLAQVTSIAQGYPMMADRRVVIVKDADKLLRTKPTGSATGKSKKKQATEDPLLAYVARPNPDTVLIFDMVKFGPKNQSPFKELAEKTTVIEWAAMKEGEVADWVRRRAKSKKRTMSESAARLLVGHLGTSLRAHANELEKLITYTSGATEISDKDVEEVVGASREYNVFELTKAIGANNRAQAATIALRMMEADKDQRQMIFVMLARFIEQLTVAREMVAKNENEKAIADALELRGGAAYFVKETISVARKYSRQRLDRAMKAIVDAEATTRRVSIGDDLLLERLIMELTPA